MAANPKPLRKESAKMASATRKHGKELFPHKGTRKAVIETKVKSEKSRPLGKRLAKFAKNEGASDYGTMSKAKRAVK